MQLPTELAQCRWTLQHQTVQAKPPEETKKFHDFSTKSGLGYFRDFFNSLTRFSSKTSPHRALAKWKEIASLKRCSKLVLAVTSCLMDPQLSRLSSTVTLNPPECRDKNGGGVVANLCFVQFFFQAHFPRAVAPSLQRVFLHPRYTLSSPILWKVQCCFWATTYPSSMARE